MRNLLLFLCLGLLVFSCQSEKTLSANDAEDKTAAVSDYRDTIVESDSVIEIGKACAVYFSPTNQQLDDLKAEVGEEDFYTIADDYAWYQAESYTFLEDKGLKTVQAEKKSIRFHLPDGSLREYSPTDISITWNVLLYNGKDQFIVSPAVEIEDAYKKLRF